MVRTTDKDRPLEAALVAALAGNVQPLYDFLCRVSGLPGPKVNETVMRAFAETCAGRGKQVDALLLTMASLHPDDAPGGTVLEFLPVCATAAIGLRGASDPRARDKSLVLLHELAEDMRFRVRDAVPEALANIGAKEDQRLLDDVEPWMDGFFHAAAVLRALARPEWQPTLHDGDAVARRLSQGFALLDSATRSSRRYPGYKALLDAVLASPRAFAPRFGVPIFGALAEAAKTKDPELANLIRSSVSDKNLRSRFASEIANVIGVLDGAAKAPRDPSRIVKGTRGRGKKHDGR